VCPEKCSKIEMKILVDVPPSDSALTKLRSENNVQIVCVEPEEEHARRLDPAILSDVDALFCTYPPTNLDDMRAVKWIQIASVGYDQLIELDLPKRGVRATNCRGCLDVPIAEWNIAMMVNLVRNLPQMFRNQANAVWDRSNIFQREIRGATLGLWGYGGIGRETARLASHMGLRIHAMTRNGVGRRENTYLVAGTGDPEGVLPHRVFRAGEELEFLAGLDFLIVAMPLTKASEGLLGERELRALRKTAFLLNPARGPIVQEAALLRALKENWFAGAALDTHFAYPLPPDHPLWKMPNVILTPHISGSNGSQGFSERLWDLFSQNVTRYLKGEPLLNELSVTQLSGK